MSNDVDSFMNEMGFPCDHNNGQFIICQIDIKSIVKIIKLDDGTTKLEDFQPMEFASYFNRKSDFTFGHKSMIREMCLMICNSILKDKKWEDAKQYFHNVFPDKKDGFMPIFFGTIDHNGPIVLTKRFKFYNIKTGEKVKKEDAQPGASLLLGIRDMQQKDWVGTSEIQITSHSDSSITKLRDATDLLDFDEDMKLNADILEEEMD